MLGLYLLAVLAFGLQMVIFGRIYSYIQDIEEQVHELEKGISTLRQ